MIDLLEVTRGGYGRAGHVESVHRGSFVLLAPDGSVQAARPAQDQAGEPVFARSSLKPMQTLTLLRCGFTGRDRALALATASHDGEDVHRSGVQQLLAAAGLTESALQCPPALPADQSALLDWVRAGGGAAPICHNCSGKHAAMLSTCVSAGWPIETYLDPEHPLQRAIFRDLAAVTGSSVSAPVVDGCGAPAFAVPLAGLARGVSALARAAAGPQALVAGAMRAHPRLVGGSSRPVTALMLAVPGLIAKEGAEGVWAAALPDGRAFAAKIADGSMRGLGPLLGAALAYWGLWSPSVRAASASAVLGAGEPVGALRWAPQLCAVLELDADLAAAAL